MTASYKHYSEKRSFIRMKVENKVSFKVKGGKERHEGLCVDISGAGMLLETGKKLQTGTELTITVPSPNNEFANLNADVRVVRVNHLANKQRFQVGVIIDKVLS